MSAVDRLPRAGLALEKRALAYPEATLDYPWGHHAVKVRGKAFAFLGGSRGALSLSVKLPDSSIAALSFPFASPTEYGLGKSGWVTARFEGKAAVPIELLASWIDESYRAIAPKKIVALLDGSAAPEIAPTKRPTRPRPSRRA